MKTKKFLACLLAGTMVLSLAACGGNTDTDTDASATGTDTSSVSESTPTPDASTPVEASIDFEDGNMGFVAPYMVPADAAELEMSVVDFAGSKALQVKNLTGKVPYVAVDATSLLGADVAKVATIEMALGVSYEDGSFNAVSGEIFAWSGADRVETSDSWSVYLETANPKTAVATLSAGEEFVADAGNIFYVQLKTDNGLDAGKGNATLYIDNIRFLDASGNLLTADSSVAFAAPDGFEKTGVDLSNLTVLGNAVEFEGFATSGAGWSQAGFDMPQEFMDALVPGSIVEIEFTSENGDMWIVMNAAEAGWNRAGDGNNGTAAINNSKTIAQIPFEMLAAVWGDDVSTWGGSMQCEASGAWEVFSVKVGTPAPAGVANAVEFEGFATSGAGWSQAGFDMPQEFIDALVPGSMVEIDYTSENGDMWIVMNAAEAGWNRAGDGNNGKSICANGKCYVPFEMLAAVWGDDVSTWGGSMQCEASGAWEVYGVRVGTPQYLTAVNNVVEFEGFATSGAGWSQAGFDMPQEIIDALVPGSVVQISYTSENDDMWIVLNAAEAGWNRAGDGNNGTSVKSNGIAQIPFEMLAAVWGDDVSTWGGSMQCEASGAWEVFSVSVGQALVTE